MSKPLHISQFFTYAHLTREDLRDLSKRFADVHDNLIASLGVASEVGPQALADYVLADLPANPEKFACLNKLRWTRDHFATSRGRMRMEEGLRLLLEAKDCAVRALLAGPNEEPESK